MAAATRRPGRAEQNRANGTDASSTCAGTGAERTLALVTRAVTPPVGTIALLFTDIEGSTELARRAGERWPDVLAEHHRLVGGAIDHEGGWVDGTEGDAFFATFDDPAAAARAAVSAQRAVRDHDWPGGIGELRVRMGLHVGFVERGALGYVGLEVHRAARIASAAHGGQLLLSGAAQSQLAEVLPTDPLGAHRLKDFPQPEHLYCAVVDGRGASAFPPPRVRTARPNNLPAGTLVLVGRETELDQITRALEGQDERLVTLTGRSGSGKTSLAMAAARQLLDGFEGGVWLVDLTTISEAGEVIAAVAAAVGSRVDTDASALDAVTNLLRGRGRTLLFLDNFDHVMEAAADLAVLLESLPHLHVLATSQAPLRLAGELVLPIDSLEDDAALALVERVARRRNPSIHIDEQNREDLLEMIHLLDGLPLALELAAARLALLSPAQLLDRLKSSSDVLRDDRSDRPDRHRSLQATVDWSLGLLDPSPRALFTRMGAFAGPVEIEDLEAVCGRDGLDVLESLFRLLEMALVRRVESGDGRIRFGLPEGLRQIAARQLDATPDGAQWRRAHAEHQLEIIWPARYIFTTRATFQAAVDATVERTAAMRWARAAGDPIFSQIAAPHAMVASDRGRVREAISTVELLSADPSPDPAQRSLELVALSWAQFAGANIDAAIEAAEAAAEQAPTAQSRSYALGILGTILVIQGRDVEKGMRDTDQAVKLADPADEPYLVGALAMNAQAHLANGDFEGAKRLLSEAERLAERSDADFIWRRYTILGDTAAMQGRYAEALEYYAESLEEAERREHDMQILFDLMGTALALASSGQDAEAVEVVTMAERHAAEIGGRAYRAFHMLSGEPIEQAEQRLGPAGVAEASRRGEEVPAARRVTRACELCRNPVPSG
jgi:predicted ATPase/class 3 adenylate cyclase